MWEISSFNHLPILIENNFLKLFQVEIIFTLVGAGDMSKSNESDAGILGKFAPIAICRQMHGNNILPVKNLTSSENHILSNMQSVFLAGESDGLVTDQPGLALGIRTADCAPVLLFSPQRKKIAAIHVGRKGAILGIIEKTILNFFKNTNDLRVAVGPHIKKCCYQFADDKETSSRFGEFYSNGKIDLTGYIKNKLTSAGIPDSNISISDYCTYCAGEDKFFSHKRSGGTEKGRHLALIRMKL